MNAPAGTTFEVKNCIIRNNSDAGITSGGGLHVTGGSTLKLTNSLVHSNAAWASGGAALIEGANLIADRCTIVFNTNNGFNRIGGISGAGNCNIQIKNSILWNNSTNQYGSFSSGPGGNATFTFSYSDIQGGTTATVGGNTKTIVVVGPGNINSDPKFAETVYYTLSPDSPCINTGDPNAAKDADGSLADMGWDAAATAGSDKDGDGVSDYREIQDGTNPSDSNSFRQLSKGLVAYYTFNGNYLNLADGKTFAIPHRDVVFVSDSNFGIVAKVTGAGVYSSTGGFIEIPEPPLAAKNEFTASMWVNELGMSLSHGESYLTAGTGGGSRILLSHLGNDYRDPYLLSTQLSLTEAVYSGGQTETQFNIDLNEIRNVWNHYIITEKNSRLVVYRNGVELYTANVSGTPRGNWHIGRHWWDGGGTEATRLIASLADLRIYNRALSANEVAQLYSSESTGTALTLDAAINPLSYGLSAAEFGDRVALDGVRVFVHQATDEGLVHLFEVNGSGGYDKISTLMPPDPVYDSPAFGESLGVSGDNLFVSSHATFRMGAHDGTAYRYRREAGGVVLKERWTELPSQWAGYFASRSKLLGDKLLVSQGKNPEWGSSGGLFMYRVDSDGTRTKVWSSLWDTSRGVAEVALTHGNAYVAQKGDTGNQLIAYTLLRDGAGKFTGVTTNAQVGIPAFTGESDCLAADGEWVVLGNREYANSGVASGAVHLFRHTNGNLTQVATIIPPNPVVGARFGSSVVLKDGILLVGSPGETNIGTSLNGCVYVFQINSSGVASLLERHRPGNPIIGSGELFGSSMSLSGDGNRVAITSSGSPIHAASGAVYIYSLQHK
jgi:hypothetical protein